MYQQRWRSKRLVRAYHGDWIGERRFKDHYLPPTLPPLKAPAPASDRTRYDHLPSWARPKETLEAQRGRAAQDDNRVPIASMMFVDVERRLDVCVFRACFAPSVYKARQMVVHGKVTLNGKKVSESVLVLRAA